MRLPAFTRSAGTTSTEDETVTTRPAVAPRGKVDDRTPYAKSSTDRTTEIIERPAPPPVAVPVEGPRPRASMMATLGMALSIGAAALVLTGMLAGYGVAVAVVAFLLSVGGFAATRRRHVAGKLDALIGMLVAAAALVVGILAITGDLPWLDTGSSTVGPTREWLDAQFPNWF